MLDIFFPSYCPMCSVQPFWPMGTGCARGFLAAFDTAWMVKNWAQGQTVLELLAERYPQTQTNTDINNSTDFTRFSVFV